MNIVIFQDTCRPKIDGVVISTELFMAQLKKMGHQVLLVVPRFPNHEQQESEDIYYVDSIDFSRFYPMTRFGKFWQTKALYKRLDNFKPDLVHSMTEVTVGQFMAISTQKRYQIPRIHTFHTLWSEYWQYIPLIPNWLINVWLRFTAPKSVRKRTACLIAPSAEMRTILRHEWNIGDFPIAVIPTGLDLKQFEKSDPMNFKNRYNIAEDERVILYLGRMGEEKNVELVLKTIAKLKKSSIEKLRYVVAGGGPKAYMKHLRQLSRELDIENDIIWTGFISGQDWVNCYAASSLFLFPSITETQGLVVIEALASGVPIVSVKAMGPASTMAGEKGCLWAENDADDFFEKTKLLLSDPKLYSDKEKEALEVAAKYSIEGRTEELIFVYEQVHSRKELPNIIPTLRPLLSN